MTQLETPNISGSEDLSVQEHRERALAMDHAVVHSALSSVAQNAAAYSGQSALLSSDALDRIRDSFLPDHGSLHRQSHQMAGPRESKTASNQIVDRIRGNLYGVGVQSGAAPSSMHTSIVDTLSSGRPDERTQSVGVLDVEGESGNVHVSKEEIHVSKWKSATNKIISVATLNKGAHIDEHLVELVKKEIEAMRNQEHAKIALALLDLLDSTNSVGISFAFHDARSVYLSEKRPEVSGLLAALEWRRECLSSRPGQIPDAELQKQAWKRGREMALSSYRTKQRKLGQTIARVEENWKAKASKNDGAGKFKSIASKVKVLT